MDRRIEPRVLVRGRADGTVPARPAAWRSLAAPAKGRTAKPLTSNVSAWPTTIRVPLGPPLSWTQSLTFEIRGLATVAW